MEVLLVEKKYAEPAFARAKMYANEEKVCAQPALAPALAKGRMDTNEEIVRHELVRVWTRLLEKYARPGVQIPSVWEVRQEMIEKGVEAAISAICDERWFVFSWMVHDEIQASVEKGLERFDLDAFIADVRIAQHDPRMLNYLREQIRYYVLDLN